MIDVSKAYFLHSTVRLDEGAFENVFNEHYPKVYAILFHLTGDRFEADDLAAETFWRLWERPPAVSENLAGWLYRVATRLGYNALRASRRREQYEIEASLGSSLLNLMGGAAKDPAQAAEQRLERERVQAVLRKMALREVQVIVLRHSGLSYKEIAAVIDVASSSVGTLLTRAETRFEALYRQGEKDAP